MDEIIVYSTPTCPYCVKLKKFLAQKGVPFKEIDVSKDEHALEEIMAKSKRMGVPQMIINKKIIVGFDPEAIEGQLNRMGWGQKKAPEVRTPFNTRKF